MGEICNGESATHLSLQAPQINRPPSSHYMPSAAPPGALLRIARLAGVPVSALSTVEVSSRSHDLYHAALEYAALHANVTPVLAESVNNDKQLELSERPLWSSPDNMYEPNHDSEIDDDCQNCKYFDPSLYYVAASPSAELKKIPRKTPRLHFGLGSTAVFWPPPTYLLPRAICSAKLPAALTENESRSETPAKSCSSLEAGEVIQLPSVLDEHISSNQTPVRSAEHEKPHDGSARHNPQMIFYVHYAVGDCVPVQEVQNPGPTLHRTLLLVGLDGQESICNFLAGVLQWRSAKDQYVLRDGRYMLYRYKTSECRGYWKYFGLRHARPLASVILPAGQLSMIVEDVKDFLLPGTKSWYIAHGLPHRRSYMLYGPPGVGKTSVIRAIASEFKLSCCFLSITTGKFNNQNLCDAFSELPRSPLLVLEDVDALFDENRKNTEGGNLTFSGVLNALDGLTSSDGVISMMTTNHTDRLDRALIRGGRVDRRFEFKRPSKDQVAKFFLSFYPGAGRDLADRFAAIVYARSEGDEARSIATLQQHFISQRRFSAENCVATLPEFYENFFPGRFNDL